MSPLAKFLLKLGIKEGKDPAVDAAENLVMKEEGEETSDALAMRHRQRRGGV